MFPRIHISHLYVINISFTIISNKSMLLVHKITFPASLSIMPTIDQDSHLPSTCIM